MNNIPATTNTTTPNVSLAGVDHSRTYSYTPVFFGAPHEYGPEEGWQTVRRKINRRRRRREDFSSQ